MSLESVNEVKLTTSAGFAAISIPWTVFWYKATFYFLSSPVPFTTNSRGRRFSESFVSPTFPSFAIRETGKHYFQRQFLFLRSKLCFGNKAENFNENLSIPAVANMLRAPASKLWSNFYEHFEQKPNLRALIKLEGGDSILLLHVRHTETSAKCGIHFIYYFFRSFACSTRWYLEVKG